MPAPPAKATFMAGSVPSMMQKIRVMKNDAGSGLEQESVFFNFLSGYYSLIQHYFIRYIHPLATGILVYLLSRRHD